MRQDGPIRARGLSALHRAIPEGLKLRCVARLAGAIDGQRCRRSSAFWSSLETASGEQHGPAVQLVIGLLVHAGQAHFDKKLARLGRGEACADDRAVKVVAERDVAPVAVPCPKQGAAALSGLSAATGFIALPRTARVCSVAISWTICQSMSCLADEASTAISVRPPPLDVRVLRQFDVALIESESDACKR
jgi:hypothetical protein